MHAAKARQPELRSARAKQDELLSDKIQRVWDDNMQCYGVVKVWKQLKREGIDIARDDCHTLTTALPPGRNTRRISSTAAGWSGKN